MAVDGEENLPDWKKEGSKAIRIAAPKKISAWISPKKTIAEATAGRQAVPAWISPKKLERLPKPQLEGKLCRKLAKFAAKQVQVARSQQPPLKMGKIAKPRGSVAFEAHRLEIAAGNGEEACDEQWISIKKRLPLRGNVFKRLASQASKRKRTMKQLPQPLTPEKVSNRIKQAKTRKAKGSVAIELPQPEIRLRLRAVPKSKSQKPEKAGQHTEAVTPRVWSIGEADLKKTEEVTMCTEMIENLRAAERDFPPCVSYCFDWLSAGNCRNPRCSYVHSHSIDSSDPGKPPNFSIDDCFKRTCNRILAALSKLVEDQRCFVLDAKAGATCKALDRHPGLILAPNGDPSVASALKGVSHSIRCTSSAALDQSALCGLQFGCVYLDYMWPLNCFAKQRQRLEKTKLAIDEGKKKSDPEHMGALEAVLSEDLESLDGFEDIKRLFGTRLASPSCVCLLSTDGAVLAVTLVDPAQQGELNKAVVSECQLMQRRVEHVGVCRELQRNIATVFYLVGVAADAERVMPAGLQDALGVICDGED